MLTIACNKQSQYISDNIVVEVEGSKLSKEELQAHIPPNTGYEDSLIIAENYIRSWIRDELVYNIASKNISEKSEIERLVNNYRKSLIIYQYKDHLINEKLSKNINIEEIQEYYNNNKENFNLDKSLIKGLFIKIPIEAPLIDNVRKWYKSFTPDAIDNIENYSIQNAVIFDPFYDNWIELNKILENIPSNGINPEKILKNNRHLEVQDSNFYYFVGIREYLLPGDIAPFEYAENVIKEILINQKKMNFLRNIEDDLYNAAQKKGQIRYHNNK